jgi:hypothetical protein
VNVRKVLSIAMLLLLAFPLVAPALGQTAEQRLLLCCRKGGMHHCMSVPVEGAPMLRAACPAMQHAPVTAHAEGWMAGARQATAVAAVVEPLKIGQVEAGYRISFLRSRNKRGPPAASLVS